MTRSGSWGRLGGWLAVSIVGLAAGWLVASRGQAPAGPSESEPVSRVSLGGSTHWTFRLPREIASVREAIEYVSGQLKLAPGECALQSVAVQTPWPARLTAEQIVLAFYPCRGRRLYLATFTNGDRRLVVVATPLPTQRWSGLTLDPRDVSVDVNQALAIAGKAGGDEMLAALSRETQVSLFLSRRADSTLWEVRYDAWREGKPLRYFVVTIDARSARVTKTTG